MSQRSTLLLLFLAVLLAAFLRVAPLNREALSGDEMFSHRVVIEPLGACWHDIREDLVHPPLYYLLLKACTGAWGAGALGLRAVSLVCGLSTLPLLASLGARLPAARWCGLLAAAGAAVARYQVFYSQEARSYALYTALVVLLVIWVHSVAQRKRSPGHWVLGALLMTALVYTHYVGGVYVALTVFSFLSCRVSRGDRLRMLGCGAAALVLFLPWLLGEVQVLHQKHGLSENLDWQGHPGFYDLRQVWADSLGVGAYPGATLLALALAAALSLAAIWFVARATGLRRSPTVMAIVWMAWLPPLLMFALSEPPVNLSLFALRHVLPSTVLLLLLCCYGLERLAQASPFASGALLAGGAACLLCMGAWPTLASLHAGPARFPYDQVEATVAAFKAQGTPTYAAWFYGEGEPVNFYCGGLCVQPLPPLPSVLPSHLLLLYRPASSSERKAYQGLLRDGYADASHRYFTDGQQTRYGTMATELERARH